MSESVAISNPKMFPVKVRSPESLSKWVAFRDARKQLVRSRDFILTDNLSVLGLGVYFGVRELCRNAQLMDRLGLPPGLKDKTVIVQGFGNGIDPHLHARSL